MICELSLERGVDQYASYSLYLIDVAECAKAKLRDLLAYDEYLELLRSCNISVDFSRDGHITLLLDD